ncbi:MAG: glutathionylspermidine synthase family protein, partial [Caulobacteraceae bacterium]|nr:glutathionylspermidine synthase family protein [Caulobacteraceae bacterium]
MGGQLYWDERAWYEFTLDQAETVETASAELHAMCLDFVADAVKSERIMARMAVPEAARDYVAETWTRGDPSLYGRFDFAYDGITPPRLYEYNADTPTSIFETAVFQWLWLEGRLADGALPAGADQYNSLFEKLRDRFKAIFPGGGFVHFASDPDTVEDRQTVRFLEDIAVQAGLDPKFTGMEAIGLDADGRFVDADDFIIQAIFKLYPWEMMLREPYAANLAASKTLFLEPAWKSLLSNKGLLPMLWERHAGHPNLLEAWFEDDPGAALIGDDLFDKVVSPVGDLALGECVEPPPSDEVVVAQSHFGDLTIGDGATVAELVHHGYAVEQVLRGRDGGERAV